MKHTQVVRELEKTLFDRNSNNSKSFSERRFKNIIPIPRDSEKGFPVFELKTYEDCYENLIVHDSVKKSIRSDY